MEATAALGLAGNITQFLDFGLKLCTTVAEISHSGSGITKNNADLQLLTKNFASSLEVIKGDLSKYYTYLAGDASIAGNAPGAGSGGSDLQAIVDGCKTVAFDMLSRLQRLKVGEQAGKWKSLVAAIKTLWREKELIEMEKKLHRFRAELQWSIVVSLRKSLDLLEVRQQDQFQQLQLSVSKVLSELLQSNSKPLPEWSANIDPAGDTAEIPTEKSAVTHSSAVDEANLKLAQQFADKLKQAEKTVLDSLDYPVMYNRETEIASAEAATFDWIFGDPRSSDRPWHNFHEWLSENGSDRLYWINGKAGSGKSTLMKYLVHHESTKKALQKWAGGTKILLSSFFFWYNGHEMQRTQIGLLRAILYSCLKNHRELIPIVVPETAAFRADEFREYWTLMRLRGALEKLVSQTTFDIKFVFFIDGLDEYAGTYVDVIETLKGVAAMDNVKVCASSRPLIAFEKAFATSPQLLLQNLTYDDIRLYTEKKLSQVDRMITLEETEPGLRDELTSSIVEKASGVFLWVCLVVGSLLEGLGNSDVGADLKRRLDDLPAELEQLYWHMVDRVKPPWYLEEGFRLLRLVKASTGSLEVIRLRHLCFAEMDEDLLHRPGLLKRPDLESLQRLCHEMTEHIKSRCLGLLEVSINAETSVMDYAVLFIHKSVSDFLETETAQGRIQRYPGHNTYQPEVSLLTAHIIEIKLIPIIHKKTLLLNDWFDWIRPQVCSCLELARFVEQATGLPNVRLMRRLEDAVDSLWLEVNEGTPELGYEGVHWISAFLYSSRPFRRSVVPSDEKLLKQHPVDRPGNIKSFDELCQKAGLDLYAREVGLEPWRPEVRRDPLLGFSRLDQGNMESTGMAYLKAAEEIWGEETQWGSSRNVDGRLTCSGLATTSSDFQETTEIPTVYSAGGYEEPEVWGDPGAESDIWRHSTAGTEGLGYSTTETEGWGYYPPADREGWGYYPKAEQEGWGDSTAGPEGWGDLKEEPVGFEEGEGQSNESPTKSESGNTSFDVQEEAVKDLPVQSAGGFREPEVRGDLVRGPVVEAEMPCARPSLADTVVQVLFHILIALYLVFLSRYIFL